jgi:hypothetical protein
MATFAQLATCKGLTQEAGSTHGEAHMYMERACTKPNHNRADLRGVKGRCKVNSVGVQIIQQHVLCSRRQPTLGVPGHSTAQHNSAWLCRAFLWAPTSSRAKSLSESFITACTAGTNMCAALHTATVASFTLHTYLMAAGGSSSSDPKLPWPDTCCTHATAQSQH